MAVGKRTESQMANGHTNWSPAQVRMVVKATFAYTGTDESQLSFSENDTLHVMGEAQGWYYGQNLRSNRLVTLMCY